MKKHPFKQIYYLSAVIFIIISICWQAPTVAAPFSNGSFEMATPPDTGESQVEPYPNGDFTLCSVNHPETFPGGLADRGNNIASWTIEAGGVDWVDGNKSLPPWPGPSDGNRYLDMSSNQACSPPTGTPAGTITQTFDTIIGQSYEVYFDMSGNPDHGTTAPKTLRVLAGGDQADYSFDFPGGQTLPWQEKMFVFTATSETTELTFQSLENNSWGPLLDNVRVVEPDSDNDGIPDSEDACVDSDLSEFVVIDGCDSDVQNIRFSDGCTISDLIWECSDDAVNHGEFVSCVSHLTNDFKKGGIISGKEKGKIQSCAAQANIP